MYQIQSELESQKKHKSSGGNRRAATGAFKKSSWAKLNDFNNDVVDPLSSSSSSSSGKRKANVGAVGDRFNRKDSDATVVAAAAAATAECIRTQMLGGGDDADEDGVCKSLRNLNFPSTKYLYPNAADAMTADEIAAVAAYRSSMLNKHGIAKTCVRSPTTATASATQQLLNATKEAARKCMSPPPATTTLPPLSPSSSSSLKLIDFNDYFNVNAKLGLTHNYYTENRSKIRDNIRRNRSFKAINSNDLIVEENNAAASVGNLSRPPYSSVIDQLFSSAGSVTGSQTSSRRPFMNKSPHTASVNDLIEQFGNVKLRNNKSNESLSSSCSGGGGGGGGSIRTGYSSPSLSKMATNDFGPPLVIKNDLRSMDGGGGRISTNPLYDGKLYYERSQTYKFSRSAGSGNGCGGSSSNGVNSSKRPNSGDFSGVIEHEHAVDSNLGIDSSFRVFKMTSEGEYNII